MGTPSSMLAAGACRYETRTLVLDLFLTFFRARNVQPTLNPDSSLGKDLVLFDRLSTKILHEYKRDDVVAL